MKGSRAIILASALSVVCAADLSSMVDQLTRNTQVQGLISQYNTATGDDQSEIFQQILTVANSVVPGAGQLISEAGSEVTGEVVQDTAVATGGSSVTATNSAGDAAATAATSGETAPAGSVAPGSSSNGTADGATMSASQDDVNAAGQYTIPSIGAIFVGIGLLML